MPDPVAAPILQIIDRWVGVPACLLLSGLNKVLNIVNPPEADGADSQPPRKLLFVKFAEQGSTVLAQVAIRRAVEIVGRENVFFVVFEENRFILDVLGLVPEENVITICRDTFPDLVKGAVAALRRIHALQIDTAIDMEFFSRSSAALTWLTRARRRIGFHTFFGEGPYRGDLMTHRLLYNPYLHTSQIFRQMVDAVLQDPAQLPTYGVVPQALEMQEPVFAAAAEEISAVRGILR